MARRINNDNHNSENILMSVCIPTYNRKTQLIELVNSILSLKRDDIDVIVTDNCSTDGTLEELNRIKDNRLKCYRNEVPIPGLNNMIQGIFNCDGKYIFYCNDRDIVVLNEFLNLIKFLEKKELAFVQTTQRKSVQDMIGKFDVRMRNSGKIAVYRRGYDSLINQDHMSHPTGMVFNGEIIRNYFQKEMYFKYLKDQYEYSFLMRDVLMYGGSAIFDCGCWDERSAVYLMKSKGKTVEHGILYFYPETHCLVVKDTLEQTLKVNDYGMPEIEKTEVGVFILRFFYSKLINYKYCMYDIRETVHYGIKRKFVSTPEMIRVFQKYFYSSLNYIEENGYSKELCDRWKSLYRSLFYEMILHSIKADLGIIRRLRNRKKEVKSNG